VEPAPDPPPDFAAVYDEMRRLAQSMLRRQARGGTLNTTGLVHEAYLKLLGTDGAPAQNRRHVFATAARAMRYILVDHARARQADKRGGGAQRVTLGPAHDTAEMRADELLALDEALARLAAERARLAQVVELRFFAGLTYDEIAETMDTSVRTAKRDWELARAWLHRELHPDA
jgi:RNA polymerase sigma factor (TIGR02999 family)